MEDAKINETSLSCWLNNQLKYKVSEISVKKKYKQYAVGTQVKKKGRQELTKHSAMLSIPVTYVIIKINSDWGNLKSIHALGHLVGP